MFAVRTAGCVYVGVGRLKPHVAEIAFAEVELAQSSAD